MDWEADLQKIMTNSERMDIVRAVGHLELHDCWAAAGIVRNTVWDALHDFDTPTPLNDIDVAYFEPTDISRETELEVSLSLERQFPGYCFSVKNQARMHLRNGHSPYHSSEDAIARWTETCTAVGVAWRSSFKTLAPYDLNDLFTLQIRPTSYDIQTLELVSRRVAEKRWLSLWPLLTLKLHREP